MKKKRQTLLSTKFEEILTQSKITTSQTLVIKVTLSHTRTTYTRFSNGPVSRNIVVNAVLGVYCISCYLSHDFAENTAWHAPTGEKRGAYRQKGEISTIGVKGEKGWFKVDHNLSHKSKYIDVF